MGILFSSIISPWYILGQMTFVNGSLQKYYVITGLLRAKILTHLDIVGIVWSRDEISQHFFIKSSTDIVPLAILQLPQQDTQLS
jgi:hypothetical protein